MTARISDSVRALGLSVDIVEQLMAAMSADTFHPEVGVQVGRQLADIVRSDGEVLRLAEGLPALAELCAHPDAQQRMASLLVSLGQGYQQRREHSIDSDRAPRSQPGVPSDDRFRLAFDHAGIAIAIGDTKGRLLDVNRALADMIGVPIADLRGISVDEIVPSEDQDEVRSRVFEQLVPARSGTVRLVHGLLRADGSRGWMTFDITFIRGNTAGGDYLLAVGEDVTERRELHHQARHDPLTGLPNRRCLLEHLDRTINAQRPYGEGWVGLCFMDLDHFKNINDDYGHSAGDRVLVEVASRLQTCARSHECSVSRIGGDEFVALLSSPGSEAQFRDFVESLAVVFEEPIRLVDATVQVSASIGAIFSPLDGSGVESVLDAADTALRKAKAAGRARWVLDTRIPNTSVPAANRV